MEVYINAFPFVKKGGAAIASMQVMLCNNANHLLLVMFKIEFDTELQLKLCVMFYKYDSYIINLLILYIINLWLKEIHMRHKKSSELIL